MIFILFKIWEKCFVLWLEKLIYRMTTITFHQIVRSMDYDNGTQMNNEGSSILFCYEEQTVIILAIGMWIPFK